MSTPPRSPRCATRRLLVPALALALVLVALPGCLYVGGSGRAGPLFEPEVVDRIVPGVTTRSEVLAILGPPSEFERPELSAAVLDEDLRFASDLLAVSRRSRKVYTWQHNDIDLDGTILILWNGFFAEVLTDLVVVMFDDDDRVLEVTQTRRGVPIDGRQEDDS